MDMRVIRELETRIGLAEKKYKEAIKSYGHDSRQVLDPVEEAIYLRGWWILFVQGCTQVWFTPWYYFKGTDAYPDWQKLESETIRAKAEKWIKLTLPG